ncbi:NAD(P)-dependent dehydrogenase, short-chain alcohol dehydrogenase family [Catalinimonas alkaloidigena]|uniref:NAD(P)-dependent dehydrogenase, short-chain alcohol dehydrogenase family n=1 Tax=Catalinimonas alkaloidigena TaxID=1075417 RepID=A0A1G9JHW0_9BACT|nr:SDR family oxidoreductase [Catalinimonas alkaloidigena]SDL36796.1 NAD(P)-dependent dehydrogenase, short-chain alcohol dehydrogenase family [Catalinimonas alkaloidigena]
MAEQPKIALVTGGSRGLGKDMALRLAEKGLDVVLTYHRKKEEAEQVVAAIAQTGRKALALQLDTSSVAGFETFMETLKSALRRTFGTDRFDYLINNAGTGHHALFAETTEAHFDALSQIHFKGVFFLTQKALALMHDGGGIVNISSGLARFSLPGASAYAAMKGAIETLTRYQAKELGARGIRANVVAPGAIATDFGGGAVRDNAELNQRVAGMTALGRAGVAEDIGGVVAFLCTEEGRWINGQRIEVSGGMNL